jgi:hypothetical protein
MTSQSQLLQSKKRKRIVETASETFFKWQATVTPAPVNSSLLVPKEKNVKTFYDEFCTIPSFATPPGQRFQLSRASLYNSVKREKLKQEPGVDVIIQRGRPTTLTPEEEAIVIENCRDFENTYGIITRFVVRTEARQMALRKRDEAERNSDLVWVNEALLRFMRVGGEKWMKGFLNRHAEITISHTKRPIEKARASKTQPEIVIQHYRNVAHTTALCQIQRKIGEGVRVEGWVLPSSEGLVTREGGKGREPGHDILEVREGEDGEKVIFVKPLNAPLEKMDPRLVAALDEKPVIPDCPTEEKMSTDGIRHMVGCSRSSTWTITPVLLASGKLLLSQLIFRGGSIASDLAKKLAKEIMVHRHDNGIQSDKSWLEFAEAWMAKIESSLKNPAIVYVDGHSSHLTRAFTRLAAKHSIFVICEPSNLSILLQTGDNGANAYIGTEYAREYSTMFALLHGAISIDHRIEALRRVMKRLGEKNDLIQHSFHAVRLTGDVMDCVGKWLPQQFAIGKAYRDQALPKVTGPFLGAVFSAQQLAQPWGTAVILPQKVCESVPLDLRMSFLKWVSEVATEEQRSRMEDATTSYKLMRTEKTDAGLAVRLWGPVMEKWDATELLKLSNSKGRVYTGEGRCLYGDSACKEAEDAEKKAEQAEQDKEKRDKTRAEKQVCEAPMLAMFVSLGILERGKFPTKKQMENFASSNTHLEWAIKVAPSQSRAEQANAILQVLSTTKSGTTFNP